QKERPEPCVLTFLLHLGSHASSLIGKELIFVEKERIFIPEEERVVDSPYERVIDVPDIPDVSDISDVAVRRCLNFLHLYDCFIIVCINGQFLFVVICSSNCAADKEISRSDQNCSK